MSIGARTPRSPIILVLAGAYPVPKQTKLAVVAGPVERASTAAGGTLL